MGVLSFLLNNKLLVALSLCVAALAGAGVYIKILNSQLEICQDQKTIVLAQLGISIESVKSLQAAIDEQNASIEAFKNDAAERQKRNESALKAAQAAAAESRRRAEEILKRPAPPNTTDCEATTGLFDEVIKDAKK